MKEAPRGTIERAVGVIIKSLVEARPFQTKPNSYKMFSVVYREGSSGCILLVNRPKYIFVPTKGNQLFLHWTEFICMSMDRSHLHGYQLSPKYRIVKSLKAKLIESENPDLGNI